MRKQREEEADEDADRRQLRITRITPRAASSPSRLDTKIQSEEDCCSTPDLLVLPVRLTRDGKQKSNLTCKRPHSARQNLEVNRIPWSGCGSPCRSEWLVEQQREGEIMERSAHLGKPFNNNPNNGTVGGWW